MKSLLLALSFLSVSAFAAAKKEVVHTKGAVSVHSLRCEIRVGGKMAMNDRMSTLLGGSDHLTIFHANLGLKLKHTKAWAKGCDLQKLNTIADHALQYYGFVMDAPIEITRETSESRLNGYNQCIADYSETVKIALGSGVVVESQESQLVSATDCH